MNLWSYTIVATVFGAEENLFSDSGFETEEDAFRAAHSAAYEMGLVNLTIKTYQEWVD